jgi:hypothetical protein
MNILNFNKNNNIFNTNTIHYNKIIIFVTPTILFLRVILLIIIKIKIFKILHQDSIELGHARPIEIGI